MLLSAYSSGSSHMHLTNFPPAKTQPLALYYCWLRDCRRLPCAACTVSELCHPGPHRWTPLLMDLELQSLHCSVLHSVSGTILHQDPGVLISWSLQATALSWLLPIAGSMKAPVEGLREWMWLVPIKLPYAASSIWACPGLCAANLQTGATLLLPSTLMLPFSKYFTSAS